MHEIVTLQFGQQSNYLGTHFWNTQESYFTYPPEAESPVNHDILFRPGVAPDGSDTFTPRTLIYDLKGAFGSMKKVGALYEPEDDGNMEQSGVWRSKPIIQRSQPIPPSAYQVHLDSGLRPPPLTTSSVRYWSDYSHLYYHPKSLVQLSEFELSDTLMPFETWETGLDLFEKMEREVDVMDRDLRPFTEECDGMQGIQIMTGVDDAWGGWTSGWLERLRDEYGKLSIWTWGLGDQGGNMAVPREKRLQQIKNSARSLNAIAEQSSVYVPLSKSPAKLPSYLSIDSTSPWHVGAIQAVAMESMTISSRLRSSDYRHGTLQDLEESFNSTGKRRIAKLEMSVADPDVLSRRISGRIKQAVERGSKESRQASEGNHTQLADFDMEFFTKDYRVASTRGHKKEHIFGRAETSRGEWQVAEDGERAQDPHDRFHKGPALQRFHAPLLFPLLDSFPAIFDVEAGNASTVAVYSALTTSTTVAEQIRTLEQIARRIHGLEERESLCNGLQMMAEEYDEGWDSGGDSDEDDD